MGLLTKWKLFLVTADTTDLLAGDQILGNTGRGVYRVTALAAAAADGTITINDGNSNVVDAAPIPLKGAAVTYPDYDKSKDKGWIVEYVGNGPNIPINVVDGTNAEIIVVVEKLSGPRSAARF